VCLCCLSVFVTLSQLDRRIIRLDMPQQGKGADQDESCAADQVSLRQNHLKPK